MLPFVCVFLLIPFYLLLRLLLLVLSFFLPFLFVFSSSSSYLMPLVDSEPSGMLPEGHTGYLPLGLPVRARVTVLRPWIDVSQQHSHAFVA